MQISTKYLTWNKNIFTDLSRIASLNALVFYLIQIFVSALQKKCLEMSKMFVSLQRAKKRQKSALGKGFSLSLSIAYKSSVLYSLGLESRNDFCWYSRILNQTIINCVLKCWSVQGCATKSCFQHSSLNSYCRLTSSLKC